MLDFYVYIWDNDHELVISSGRSKEEAIQRFLEQYALDVRARFQKLKKGQFQETEVTKRVERTEKALVAMEPRVVTLEKLVFYKQGWKD